MLETPTLGTCLWKGPIKQTEYDVISTFWYGKLGEHNIYATGPRAEAIASIPNGSVVEVTADVTPSKHAYNHHIVFDFRVIEYPENPQPKPKHKKRRKTTMPNKQDYLKKQQQQKTAAAKKTVPAKGKQQQQQKTAAKKELSNYCLFRGYLGQDADMHFLDSGKAYINFSIGVWQGKDKKPMWVKCFLWEGEHFDGDTLTDELFTDLNKGSKVEVRGRLNQNEYNGKNYLQMTVQEITILEVAQSELSDDDDEEDDEEDDKPF